MPSLSPCTGKVLSVAESDEYVLGMIAAAVEMELETCARIALAIDSGRGNEKEIAAAIRARIPYSATPPPSAP